MSESTLAPVSTKFVLHVFPTAIHVPSQASELSIRSLILQTLSTALQAASILEKKGLPPDTDETWRVASPEDLQPCKCCAHWRGRRRRAMDGWGSFSSGEIGLFSRICEFIILDDHITK